MNIFTLLPEQKIKLLELCKQFIPEHKSEMYFDDDTHDTWEEAIINKPLACGNDAMVECVIFNRYTKKAFHIHWYQLCLTELPKGILYNMAANRQDRIKDLTVDEFFNIAGSAQDKLDNLICDITNYPFKHPVEVLYNYCQQNK